MQVRQEEPMQDTFLKYADKNKYEKIILFFNQRIEQYPQDSGNYHYRGLGYFLQGNAEKAIVDLYRAIQLAPDDAMLSLSLGDVFNYENMREEALENYDLAIQKNPDLSPAYIARAGLYTQLQNPQALEDLNEALKRNPNDAWAYNARGYYYFMTDQLQNACEDFSKALALNNSNPDFLQNMAEAHFLNHQRADALQKIQQIVESDKNNFSRYLVLANMLYACEAFEKGKQLFKQIKPLETAKDYYIGGISYFDRAKIALRLPKELFISKARSLWDLDRLKFLSVNKKLGKAKVYLEKALELGATPSQTIFIHHNLAGIKVLMAKITSLLDPSFDKNQQEKIQEEALKDAEVCIELDSNFLPAYIIRYEIYKIKKDDNAVKEEELIEELSKNLKKYDKQLFAQSLQKENHRSSLLKFNFLNEQKKSYSEASENIQNSQLHSKVARKM